VRQPFAENSLERIGALGRQRGGGPRLAIAHHPALHAPPGARERCLERALRLELGGGRELALDLTRDPPISSAQ
jgi:hypothetical protein